MKTATKHLFATVSIALITACGGGSSGGGGGTATPVASTLAFDASTSLRALIVSGQSSNFSVSTSNGCTGTASFTSSAQNTITTFEGQSALSSTSMFNINYSNCTTSIISNTQTNYTDSNYMPKGSSGERYLVYTGVYNAPSIARVGDVGIIANALRYTNSSKTTQDGSAQFSYFVEADTASSALITVVSKSYTVLNVLEATQLTKYRINSSNQLSLISITTQYPSGINIVMTRT